MSQSFRERHLYSIVSSYETQSLPLDVFLKNYFKSHKSIGSHDRKYLAETLYGMIRWQGLLDYLCTNDRTWKSRYEVYKSISPQDFITDETIPLHIRVSFPKSYFSLLSDTLGNTQATHFCLESNFAAPTTVRANALKISRDTLISLWKDKYTISPCEGSSYGLIFEKRENFFGMEEFKSGFFEVQDEGSQLIADLVEAKPGDHVLDFCSGSGGKTLAFASKLQGKGQIYLHDIRSYSLLEAKKRLKRAGIQNAQIMNYHDEKKKKLKGHMDWVLVDGPCSGSGTLRRNPDMKWKFDLNRFSDLLLEQRNIFAEALVFVKPKKFIVYSTCSILPQENEEQVEYFIKQHNLKLIGSPFKSMPKRGGMDGFFGAVLQKP